MWDADSFRERALQQPVAPRVQRGDITRELRARYSFDAPMTLSDVIEDVDRLLLTGNVHTIHPRYFGLFNPNVHESSVIAELMNAAINPQAGAWFHSPVAVEIEAHTLRFFARKFGMPEEYGAHFTTGGSEANLTSVLTALAHRFPEARNNGVRAISEQPVLLVSAESHHSFEKIAQHTGLGRDAVHVIEADEHDRMRVDALRAAIAKTRNPFFVVATAGTTGSGAIDPIRDVAAICRDHGLWLHVDAAWGGAACVSARLRKHLDGIELADSITCDAHKWLSVPMGAGMFFTRHRAAIDAAFSVTTPYVPEGERQEPDAYASSLQWSRRFIGLKVFMMLATLGEEALAKQIEHHVEIADYLRQRLIDEGFNVVSDSPLAVVCVAHAEAPRIANAIVERGKCWVSPLVREGKPPAIRMCITNFATKREDVDVLVEELLLGRRTSSSASAATAACDR